MELFRCPACGARLFFRNTRCGGCGAALAFDPDARVFLALGGDVALCANRAAIACQWRADPPAEGASEGALCRACAMTRTIPDPQAEDSAALWAEAEDAKRWVLANLMRWGLFGPKDPHPAPIFDMLAEKPGEAVTMGHADGVVTINVAEADPAIREARRAQLAERYRTMTGHFRHEIGHLLFTRLSGAPGFLDAFRALFGDERADYAAALQAHYAAPRDGNAAPPPGFLTDYAAAHPHEDWAETLAHYLHLVDICDSAAHAGLGGLVLDPVGGAAFDAYESGPVTPLLDAAGALSVALNHVNRAMGLADLYPFVLTPPIREKLGFAHDWIRAAGR